MGAVTYNFYSSVDDQWVHWYAESLGATLGFPIKWQNIGNRWPPKWSNAPLHQRRHAATLETSRFFFCSLRRRFTSSVTVLLLWYKTSVTTASQATGPEHAMPFSFLGTSSAASFLLITLLLMVLRLEHLNWKMWKVTSTDYLVRRGWLKELSIDNANIFFTAHRHKTIRLLLP